MLSLMAGMTAGYGWLTCAVTTTCSVPPAPNYCSYTKTLNMKGFAFIEPFYAARLVFWPFQKVSAAVQNLNDCRFYTVTLNII